MKVAILLPAYNVGAHVGTLLDELGSLDAVRRGEWVRVVIDDGSRDDSAEIAEAHGATVLRHGINRGKGAALATGFSWAVAGHFDAVVTMDADGQHEAASVPSLVEACERTGAGIVIGNRMSAVGQMPPLRIWTNRTTSRLVSRVSGARISDSQSGFRVIRTAVLRRVRLVSTRYDAESELLIKAARAGFDIAESPIRSVYRGSESHINPVVDTFRFLRVLWRSTFAWRDDS